jgi:proton-dependent oligopeptide transporter, POT family
VSIGILSTNSISQAGQMETSGVPNNLLMALNSVALVVIGIIIDNSIYPFPEKRRIVFRDMARIEVGLLFLALSMAYSTMVQALIYSASPCYNYPMECTGPDGQLITGPNGINLFVQLPVCVIVAVSEVFAMVTGQAYAYKQAPVNMKSLLQSIYAVFNGIGYLLAVAIGPTARNPYLVVMWACVTGVMGAAAIISGFALSTMTERPLRTDKSAKDCIVMGIDGHKAA